MDLLDAQQIMDRADCLAKHSSMANGLTRTYLSEQHKQAHLQLAEWMGQAGLETWQDSVGNQWGRKVASDPQAPILVIGSHSDSVVDAGKYDGNLGILLAIAAMDNLQGCQLPFHVDIVAFADEEGVRFDTTLIGSSAVAGHFDPQWLAIKDCDNISMAEAMRSFGLDPDKAGEDARHSKALMAYLEVHIEQGPVLEAEQQAVGVVTGIAGAKRYQFQVKGMAGHAGTVPITMRADALCGVAEMIMAIESYAKRHHLVATVGKCDVQAGSVNVIPGEVSFTLDIRNIDQAGLNQSCDELLFELQHIAKQRQLSLSQQLLYQAQAVPCSSVLQQCWAEVVQRVTEQEPIYLPSGAGHDALAMAHVTEVGMLFVRCEKGISHHPLESVSLGDVAVALQCLTQMVLAQQEACHAD